MAVTLLNGEILPSGFTVYRCDRGSRGGGVLLAVNNSLPSRQLHTPSLLELLTVEVSSKPPILICVYIPPSSSLKACPHLHTDPHRIRIRSTSILSALESTSKRSRSDRDPPDPHQEVDSIRIRSRLARQKRIHLWV